MTHYGPEPASAAPGDVLDAIAAWFHDNTDDDGQWGSACDFIEHAADLLDRFGHPTDPPCSVCGGRGYLMEQTYGYADIPAGAEPVQRCDTCQRYDGDGTAAVAAAGPGDTVGYALAGDEPGDYWVRRLEPEYLTAYVAVAVTVCHDGAGYRVVGTYGAGPMATEIASAECPSDDWAPHDENGLALLDDEAEHVNTCAVDLVATALASTIPPPEEN